MNKYVDGFVVPVPKDKLDSYKKISTAAGKLWMKYGAIEYLECAGDDLEIKGMYSFNKLAKVKPGETVVFSFISYKSRAHRDKVNKAVMADPKMKEMMNVEMPMDCKKMAYGGFKSFVAFQAKA